MFGHATPPLSPAGMVLFMYFRAYNHKRLRASKALREYAGQSRFAGNPRFIKVVNHLAHAVSVGAC